MSVKDKAKMFSSNNSENKQTLLPKDKSSSSSFCSKIKSFFSNIGSSCSNICSQIKQAFKDIWNDKNQKYIFLGVITFVIVLILAIIIISATSSSTYSGGELEKPDCSGVCERPYDIKVYTDGILRHKLKECGYKEGDNLFSYALSAIKRHNVLRACHNAQPLMFNCEIMEIAQKYSEYLAKEVGTLVHSNTRFHDKWMGENLAYVGGSYNINPSGEYPTNMWYNEIKSYDFNHPGFNMNTGHFTQVVWKDSKEFGIGLYCQNNKCFMTGNYFPGGNFNDAYATQVQNLQ